MSEIDIRALEATFQNWKQERAPDESASEAFERFSAEQILKDDDLSDDEFESGHFGGEDDGGVDAMYFFVNRTLMQEGTDIPEPALAADLVIIQAKHGKSFSENAVDKIHQFTRDLIDYSKPVEALTYLNSLARDCIDRFRDTYEKILSSPHTFNILFHYAIDGDLQPNPKVKNRVDNLKTFVKQTISAANVSFAFWDCKRLLEATRSVPSRRFTLRTTSQFSTNDSRAVVCLVQLQELAAFLTDENGNLRRSILESNVRAYQGSRNKVNQDIRRTLDNIADKDFWWFNNGITILADEYSFTGPNLVVTKPQIVNGLQTSQEIFDYLKHSNGHDTRNVLIRVVLPPTRQRETELSKPQIFRPQYPQSLCTLPINFTLTLRIDSSSTVSITTVARENTGTRASQFHRLSVFPLWPRPSLPFCCSDQMTHVLARETC